MNLYLIRHGQSYMNLNNLHSGWSMLPLTEKGFEDAKRAGEKLKSIPFDRIYSSDLTRAVQTCQTALPGTEPIKLPLIRERSVGSLMEVSVTECFEKYGETYKNARASLDFTPFGGENVDMLTARAREFLQLLESDPAENIAAFTHYGFIEVCFDLVLGFRYPRSAIYIQNGSVIHLQYRDNKWRYIVE